MTVCNDHRVLVADEWFSDFIEKVQASPGRIIRAQREALRRVPKKQIDIAEYDQQTEQYRRYLAHQRANQEGTTT